MIKEITMKRTFSQIALRIISIMQFLSGLVFILLIGLLFVVVDGNDFATLYKQDRYNLIFDIVKLVLNIILLFISWYILRKVSKDASRHNDALTITMAVIAYEIFNFITALGKGVPRNLVAMIVSVVINLIALIFISNVKKSYEEYMKNNRDDN